MNIGSTSVGRAPALQAGFLSWMLTASARNCKSIPCNLWCGDLFDVVGDGDLHKGVGEGLEAFGDVISGERLAVADGYGDGVEGGELLHGGPGV